MPDSLGPQAGKGTEPVWPGSGGHAAGRGRGGSPDNTVYFRASWATMLARPLRMVSRALPSSIRYLASQARQYCSRLRARAAQGALNVPGEWDQLVHGTSGHAERLFIQPSLALQGALAEFGMLDIQELNKAMCVGPFQAVFSTVTLSLASVPFAIVDSGSALFLSVLSHSSFPFSPLPALPCTVW